MSMKKRLTRKHILLIVLCAALLAALIAGSVAVYAKYTKAHSAGSGISVRVEPPSRSGLVETPYSSDIPFVEIPSVYPFG